MSHTNSDKSHFPANVENPWPVSTEIMTSNAHALATDLIGKCHALLQELDDFKAFLVERKKESTVELRHFRQSISAEVRSLEKLEKVSAADPTAERTIHTLRSSNVPFFSAVWTAAKSTEALVAFNKRFYWNAPTRNAKRAREPRKRSALVDIVAKDGSEWIKVSTITESRLLYELAAKMGWDSSSESEEEDRESPVERDDCRSDDENSIELVKLAGDLKKAASTVRVRYKHPTVRFVLPKLREGAVPKIDDILRGIRRTGAIIECVTHTAGSRESPFKFSKPEDASQCDEKNKISLESIFSRLAIDPFSNFTSTLNLDCTILLALVSDLSHGHILSEPWFHRAIKRQIEIESKEQLMTSNLWPAMKGRDLVCTVEATKRMREIVDIIGTPAEKARSELIMGSGGLSSKDLREEFQFWSAYEVPKDWKLPIREVQADVDMCRLPPIAFKVRGELTAINRSVFLYGWEKGITTISSNKTVAKLIESIMERERMDEDTCGPEIYLCPTARSLVGKEKGRKE